MFDPFNNTTNQPPIQEQGLFDFDGTISPTQEHLPHRNKPYENDYSIKNIFQPQTSAQIATDSDLELRAELETHFMMLKLAAINGIGKGGLAAFIVSDADKKKLEYAQINNMTDVPEIQDIIKKIEIKEKLEKTEEKDDKKTKDFLKKVVLIDLKRQRELGTLKIQSSNYYFNQMILAEFANITGNNFEIISTLGQNIIRFIKQKI